MIDYNSIFDDFKAGNMTGLYTHLYSGLILFASNILGSELAYMAEDCVQDAILDSYINRHAFESSNKWRNYLLTVIRNRAVDAHRKLNSQLKFIQQGQDNLIDHDISVDLISQETFDTLYAAIDTLPPHYREIFTLSFEQGLKNTEIAKLLGLSEIGIKKRKARMLDLLRTRLGLKSHDDLIFIITVSQFITLS
ncbi:MAG: sigma-70 family RNA polymerase sigma factor [Bacteroidales bacterium]|nr:sigma-70 family RNA polymerase sigma factor [Bacteroidales bacterium]